MYGREPRTPFSNELPPVNLQIADKDSRNFVEKSQERANRARAIALENHEIYRNRMAAQANKQGVQAPFAVGSKVWRLNPRELRSKLSLNYSGPWTVKEVIGNTYKIEKEGEHSHRPQADLKPYEPPVFDSQLEEEDHTVVPSVDWRQAIMPWAIFLSNNHITDLGGENMRRKKLTNHSVFPVPLGGD